MNVTDRQTDTQTAHRIGRACIASHGKNKSVGDVRTQCGKEAEYYILPNHQQYGQDFAKFMPTTALQQLNRDLSVKQH